MASGGQYVPDFIDGLINDVIIIISVRIHSSWRASNRKAERNPCAVMRTVNIRDEVE